MQVQEKATNYMAGLSLQHRQLYIGFCHGVWHRKTMSMSGYAKRWSEQHINDTLKSSPQCENKRYAIWTRYIPAKTHMIPLIVDTPDAAYEREQFIIRSFAIPTLPEKKADPTRLANADKEQQ